MKFIRMCRLHWGLTHSGRVTHICVGKLTIIGSDNGLSPERHQAIIWTNVGILLIGPLGRNFSEILIEIQTSSLKKIRLKMSSAKCCSFRLDLNVLIPVFQTSKSYLHLLGPGLLSEIHVYIHVSEQRFSNMAFDWLAAVLPANQMPGLKNLGQITWILT